MCILICTLLLSRPARGAWVEIKKKYRDEEGTLHVAPRKGRVG